MTLAPFPWFGGKSRAAPLIWQALGDVPNYVEPFAGSLAALLARPNDPGIETVNDADGFLANFWRAVTADPEAVARAADWPVNETDLSARHLWLVARRAALTERLQVDPDHYDAKIAGWWVWGACAWIGSGWCSGEGPWTTDGERWRDRRVSDDPHLGNAGRGINRQLPHLGDAGAVLAWFATLAARLRNVRVCCGDWSRVVTDSITTRHGVTGILLDPPYPDGWDADGGAYSAGSAGVDVWYDAAAWAATAGEDRNFRIVLCGYAGTWDKPAGWREVPWKARGGYGSGNGNPERERLWLSPGCLDATGPGSQTSLFGSTP